MELEIVTGVKRHHPAGRPLGRELEYFDMPQVRAVVRGAARDDYRFASIVKGIVSSDAFRIQALPHTDTKEITARTAE